MYTCSRGRWVQWGDEEYIKKEEDEELCGTLQKVF